TGNSPRLSRTKLQELLPMRVVRFVNAWPSLITVRKFVREGRFVCGETGRKTKCSLKFFWMYLPNPFRPERTLGTLFERLTSIASPERSVSLDCQLDAPAGMTTR